MAKKRGDAAQILIKVDGETHNISEWARIRGITRQAISKRLKAGWSPRDAVMRGPAEVLE
jgi:hypothetical protein